MAAGTLNFTRDAAGSYSAVTNEGGRTRYHSVIRLSASRWVATMSYGHGEAYREEAPTMKAAKVLAEVRELAEQGRTGEALALKNGEEAPAMPEGDAPLTETERAILAPTDEELETPAEAVEERAAREWAEWMDRQPAHKRIHWDDLDMNQKADRDARAGALVRAEDALKAERLQVDSRR